jgi:hypothetical protein
VRAKAVGPRRLFWALFSAAVAGWLSIASPFLVYGLSEGGIREVFSGLIILGMFGLPFAVLAVFLIGTPVALLALRRGWTSRKAAAGLGLISGALIALLYLIWQLLTSSGSWGGGDGMLWVDGWPTELGWRYELRNLALFGLAGALAGLAARIVAFR